jgi:hypothetical protein
MFDIYEVFNSFLQTGTWHTRHDTDIRRFFVALGKVVSDPDFNAEAMGSYMRNELGIDPDDRATAYNDSIDLYTSDAWAVREYLGANNLRYRGPPDGPYQVRGRVVYTFIFATAARGRFEASRAGRSVAGNGDDRHPRRDCRCSRSYRGIT